MEPIEEVARLLAIQIRRTAPTQAEAILELSRAGFSARRVAELLGTTPATVEKDLQRARNKSRRKTSSARMPKE